MLTFLISQFQDISYINCFMVSIVLKENKLKNQQTDQAKTYYAKI